jgi:hypothetical protein
VALRRSTLMRVAWTVVAAGVASTGLWAATDWWASAHGTPSCSWPLRIHGTATGAQPGLVRCYLQAIAEHNTAELRSVAQNIPPAHISGSDFKYSADARSGVTTVTFTPNPNDTTFVYLTIRFADGTVDNGAGLINMTAMGGNSVWRMAIG